MSIIADDKQTFLDAWRDGIVESVKLLAQREAVAEISESPDLAETQAGNGLRLARDALARGRAEIEKLFTA